MSIIFLVTYMQKFSEALSYGFVHIMIYRRRMQGGWDKNLPAKNKFWFLFFSAANTDDYTEFCVVTQNSKQVLVINFIYSASE